MKELESQHFATSNEIMDLGKIIKTAKNITWYVDGDVIVDHLNPLINFKVHSTTKEMLLNSTWTKLFDLTNNM